MFYIVRILYVFGKDDTYFDITIQCQVINNLESEFIDELSDPNNFY